MIDYIKRHLTTVYHPCGTAKMGPPEDENAVVGLNLQAQLRCVQAWGRQVRGITGLRVADASIFPQVLTANLNAACATWRVAI